MRERIRAPRAESQREGRRALLLFPGALGDLVLLAPSAAALAAAGWRVELAVTRVLMPLVARLVPGPAAPPIDGTEVATLFGGVPAPRLAAWVGGADVVHAWVGMGAAGAEVAERLRGLGAADVRLHAVERGTGGEHAAVAYARALGLSSAVAGAPARLTVDADDAPRVWGTARNARLVVHPGAGARAKRWTVEGFRRVTDLWVAEGGEVTVALGPADGDLAPAWGDGAHGLVRDPPLLELAALLASADRYLGNDAGPSHLAAAAGCAGVAVFGPTDPGRWHPLGARIMTLRLDDLGDAGAATVVLRLLGTPGAPFRVESP